MSETSTEAYLALRDADVYDQVRTILTNASFAPLADRALRATTVLWDHVQQTEALRTTHADLSSAWGEYQSLADRFGTNDTDHVASQPAGTAIGQIEHPRDAEEAAPTRIMEPIGIDDTIQLDEVAL